MVAWYLRCGQDILSALHTGDEAGGRRAVLATQLLDKHVYSQPGHKWHKEGMSKEQLQKIQEFYKIRYGEQK